MIIIKTSADFSSFVIKLLFQMTHTHYTNYYVSHLNTDSTSSQFDKKGASEVILDFIFLA